MKWAINLNTTPHEVYEDLRRLDQGYLGTKKYMGLAYFWAYEYRHYLRSASISNLKLVHKKLIEAGLDISLESPEHLEIISRWAKPRC